MTEHKLLNDQDLQNYSQMNEIRLTKIFMFLDSFEIALVEICLKSLTKQLK